MEGCRETFFSSYPSHFSNYVMFQAFIIDKVTFNCLKNISRMKGKL